MPALGEEFRSAREARGLTLSNVAEQIYIRSVYLNAIENEDWASIGAPVYVRGFIRTYARFLGLDGESAVERFNQSAPVEKTAHGVSPTALEERDRTGPSVWAVIGAIVAVVLVGFAGYEWWAYAQGKGTGAPVATVPVTSPSAAPPAAAAAASPAATASARPVVRRRLEIRLTQRSWVRVAIDGTTRLEGILPAGTVHTFTGSVADLRVGNAGGVLVSVDNRRPASLGHVGDVVERRFPL